MKLSRNNRAALSLVEIMIGIGIIGVACAGVFDILRTGTVLFGKNTSINLSHTESRYGLLKLQQDLTSAVSTPLLTSSATPVLSSGSASTIISGTGPAAGVYFQDYGGGPFCLLTASSAAVISTSATTISVVTGSSFTPLAGETIHISAVPLMTTSTTSLLEAPVSSVSTSGSVSTLTLSRAIGGNSSINVSDPITKAPLYVACFFTTPVVYVVQNGQLVKYSLSSAGSGAVTSTVLVNNFSVTSAAPFRLPSIDTSPANTFVNVVGFSAVDVSSTNRGYRAITTPFTVMIPHFVQMTLQY